MTQTLALNSNANLMLKAGRKHVLVWGFFFLEKLQTDLMCIPQNDYYLLSQLPGFGRTVQRLGLKSSPMIKLLRPQKILTWFKLL